MIGNKLQLEEDATDRVTVYDAFQKYIETSDDSSVHEEVRKEQLRTVLTKLLTKRSVEDLSPLADLTALEELSLNDLSFDPVWSLKRLTKLDLSDLALANKIDSIAKLDLLTDLRLTGAIHVHNLQPLSDLKNLNRLDLNGCEELEELRPLESLMNLTELNLTQCKSLSNIGPLSKIGNLAALSLRGCENIGTKYIKNLKSLKNLKQIDLVGTNDRFTTYWRKISPEWEQITKEEEVFVRKTKELEKSS